jgi:hypothetical protein
MDVLNDRESPKLKEPNAGRGPVSSTHPCPERNSNHRSQCSIFRRQDTPQDGAVNSVTICQSQDSGQPSHHFLIMETDMEPSKFGLLLGTRLTENILFAVRTQLSRYFKFDVN